ncbi:MAG: isoprenyl transferase [Flavobacteriales bacterium]|nr:isoprenyl transferase [Flavobacteriales bacterium]
MSLKDQISKENVPEHVAIIMDGNGRWAKQQGELRIFGHSSGVEAVREALTAAGEIGVKHLTLYAFSTENWNRPKEEVDALMDLLVSTIMNEIESLNENKVRLSAIGNIKSLPDHCQAELQKGIDETASNTGVNLNLALSYSSRWELTTAIKEIAMDVASKKIDASEINEEIISSYLSTSHLPDPELMIRTSGENRISNFLLWQIAYSELYFTDILWPDFRKDDFYRAILDYQNRERRFGKTSEQIHHI